MLEPSYALCGRKPKTSLFIVNHKDIEFELSLKHLVLITDISPHQPMHDTRGR